MYVRVVTELLAVLPAATLIFLFGVPFVVGLLAGFQGVWQRFQYDAFRALKTPPGTAYLLSRGVVPFGLFWGLYTHRALSSTDASSWGLAVGCGVGSEAILRAKVYVKTDQQGADSYAGLFDLLKFYQDLCLEAAASWLARWRKALVSRSMNNGPAFPNVLGRVRQNLQGLNDPALLARTFNEITQDLTRLETEYNTRLAALPQDNPGPAQQQLDDLNREFRIKLGYFVLVAVKQSRRSYRTVVEE